MANDQGRGSEGFAIARFPGALLGDGQRAKGLWRIEKFDAPIEWYLARAIGGGMSQAQVEALGGYGAPAGTFTPAQLVAADAALRRDLAPYEVAEFTNILLNAGITALWNIFFGNTSAANTAGSAAGANAVFNNAQARIGIGDSSTAAAATQTDLQAATNKYWQVMDATFPSVSGQGISFKATIGSGNANFAWNEWGCDNCGGSNATSTTRSGGSMLNRAVSAQGTKAVGQTWVPTATITLS